MHVLLLVLPLGIFQLLELSQHQLKVLGLHREAGLLLAGRGDVVGFVKDQNAVFKINVEVLADFLIDQVVVGHKDQICALSSIFHGIIGTKDFLLCDFVKALDVVRGPVQGLLGLLPVFEVNARVQAFLHGLAPSIQGKALVHVN